MTLDDFITRYNGSGRMDTGGGAGTLAAGVMSILYMPIVYSVIALGLAMAAPVPADSALLGVSWRYNWAAVDTTPTAPGEFVPMLWSGNPSPSIPRDYAGVILALNEPDNPKQLSISPQEAARRLARAKAHYPRARVIAPGCLSYSLDWLAAFVAQGVVPHAWAYHAYVEGPHDADAVIRQLEQAHVITGGTAWITEFGVLSGDAGEFGKLLDWFAAQYWIERIAAYTNRQPRLGHAWELAPGVELVGDGGLTACGQVYRA